MQEIADYSLMYPQLLALYYRYTGNAAALLLLTADEELWQRVLWHFDSSGFDFPAIRLSGIHPELYSIYQAAKTISVGGDNIVICKHTQPADCLCAHRADPRGLHRANGWPGKLS